MPRWFVFIMILVIFASIFMNFIALINLLIIRQIIKFNLDFDLYLSYILLRGVDGCRNFAVSEAETWLLELQRASEILTPYIFNLMFLG